MDIRDKVKKLGLVSLSICVSVGLLELGLRLFTIFPIHIDGANKVYDPHLRYRVSTSVRGIDANGFRNPAAVNTADIVTIGDSHTYGVNVASEDSWPRQLANLTGKTIYNFGLPGYGILQYLYLIDAAIKLEPDYIIIGLYLPNDLGDICRTLRELTVWRKWAKENGYDYSLCEVGKKTQRRDTSIFKAIVRKTAIYSLAHYISARASIFFPHSADETTAVIVDEKDTKTIIPYTAISGNARSMDKSKKAIRAGFQLAERVLRKAKRKTALNGVRLVILFVPSKERVFYDFLKDKGYTLPVEYHRAISNERALVESLSELADEIQIPHVDAAPAVLQELYESRPVYLSSGDDHPLKAGYEAYAKAVYHYIFSGARKAK